MAIQVLVGDCRETLATLTAESVHCIVTSPPYYGLRDYQEAAQIGLEDTPDAYVAELVGVFREVRRVLRDDGVAWLNLGDSYSSGNSGQRVRNSSGGFSGTDGGQTQSATTANPGRPPSDGPPGNLLGMPWRVAFALQSDGWTLRDACVWHKPNPMPESVAGTRWERCRVKVRNISPGEPGWCSSFGTNNGAYHEKRAREGYGCEHRQVEWADCPGCDKCAATDGYVLRAGSWRHTSSHEMVFMLTKGMGYFCDQEAVREANSESSGGWQTRAKRGLLRSHANGYGGNSETMQAKRDGSPAEDGLGGVAGQNPSGRNPRNVWSITTKPYSGAHFATMPPDLAERCIKAATSSKGACPACGAQWAPVVEREPDQRPTYNREGIGEYAQRSGRNDSNGRRSVMYPGGGGLPVDFISTIDHRPTCDCPPADPIPATVLDPFGGAGTTALVADRLGRDAILCELNADYAELARERLVGDAPMLASVEVVG